MASKNDLEKCLGYLYIKGFTKLINRMLNLAFELNKTTTQDPPANLLPCSPSQTIADIWGVN